MRTHYFSMLEVVISLAILALSLTGLLQLMISSQKRAALAYEKWDNMHKITQGAEYFLLCDKDTESIDEQFFPYTEYQLNITYDDVEDLPEELNNQTGQLPLSCMHLELIRSSDGTLLETLRVDRIDYSSTVEGE